MTKSTQDSQYSVHHIVTMVEIPLFHEVNKYRLKGGSNLATLRGNMVKSESVLGGNLINGSGKLDERMNLKKAIFLRKISLAKRKIS